MMGGEETVPPEAPHLIQPACTVSLSGSLPPWSDFSIIWRVSWINLSSLSTLSVNPGTYISFRASFSTRSMKRSRTPRILIPHEIPWTDPSHQAGKVSIGFYSRDHPQGPPPMPRPAHNDPASQHYTPAEIHRYDQVSLNPPPAPGSGNTGRETRFRISNR